jgi:sulfur-oxidizing protein SoxZ
MGEPIKIRAVQQGAITEVRALMAHEMETGNRKDASGKLIPAHFIQLMSATHNGRVVFSAQWGPAIAKNPFLSFKFTGAAKGDKIQIHWTDNRGDKRSDEAVIG